jgi:predicted amidohydrolase YtcJ
MPVANLILQNAKVITMDERTPAAEFIAIQGEKISAVGNDDLLKSTKGADTKVIDCGGKTVVPGFNDAHHHISGFLKRQLDVDLSPTEVSSISDIKEAIGRRAKDTPPGGWIVGSGYVEFYIEEKRPPNRWEIDDVAPNNPVMLGQFSGHYCVLNSKALDIAGITKDSPNLPARPIIRDPDTGEPTGSLPERNPDIWENVIPPLSAGDLAKAASLANEHYLSQGITSLQEASVANSIKDWQRYKALKDTGALKSRISMMAGMENLSQFQEADLTTGSGDNQLRLGGAKMYILNEPDGRATPSQPELNEILLNAHQAGFQLAIHILGESALEALIAGLEYVQTQSALSNRRHRIEHCSPIPAQYIEQLHKLGVIAVGQPTWVYYSGDRYIAQRTAEHLEWLIPVKSLLDAGIVFAASSDCPVVPDNPMPGIYATVTRKTRLEQQIRSEQGISVNEALALYTTNAAYASFEEDTKGSIAPGKLADMVVLSDDPTSIPSEQIKDIKVEMTIIDGEVVWEA